LIVYRFIGAPLNLYAPIIAQMVTCCQGIVTFCKGGLKGIFPDKKRGAFAPLEINYFFSCSPFSL
jgi:hypothetical protein